MENEDAYFEALTSALRLEDSTPELDAIREEFPGVVMKAILIQGMTASGSTRYTALYRGHAVTAYSIRSLHGQLEDISHLPPRI